MSDPRIPPRETCVLRYQLEAWAEQQPNKTFALFETGERWSYAQTRARAQTLAGALQAMGVQHGDTVISWLPNGPEALQVWFGCNWIGAIYVPLNTAYRGGLLQHVVTNANARVMICHRALVERLDEIELGTVDTLVVVGGRIEGAHSTFEEFLSTSKEPELSQPIEPWDIQYIIFTSGTTGASKGVLIPYLQTYSTGAAAYGQMLDAQDRFMINLPLFHCGGTGLVACMLAYGGSVAVVEYFRTEQFWQQVRELETTSSIMVGAMTPFLLKSAPTAEDHRHSLRTVLMVPLGEDSQDFAKRFNVDVFTTFNMTEVSSPLMSQKNPDRVGVAGKVRPGVELRIVDEFDRELPCGAIGELIVRTDAPWAMNAGYNQNPEATAKAWRNGWFHTGDAFRCDAQGYYYFVDRIKDAIRRRGENISSFEVEAEVQLHPAVREVAAIGVPSEDGEDEVMVVIACANGVAFDPVALTEALRRRMPHFMVPRFVRTIPELPKTPTQKIQKHVLKEQGVTDDTWDREAAGIIVKREAIC